MKRKKRIKLKNITNNHVINSNSRNTYINKANIKNRNNIKNKFKYKKIETFSNNKVINPIEIFKKEDKEKRKMGKIDKGIFYTTLLLISIGIIMIFSSSGYYALRTKGDAYYFINNTLKYLPIGFLGMAVCMCIDYHEYKRFSNIMYIFTILLLIIVLFQPDMNGATRWIYIGTFSFQPSEIAKYVIVFFLAATLEKRKKLNGTFTKGTLYYLALSGIFAMLIEKENNLSIATIIMIVTCILIYLGGVKLWNLIMLIIPVIPLGIYLIKSEGYRMLRITGFLDPWNDTTGKSYQLIQSFYAIASGGITGRGIGQSIIKNLYMPEPHNDFIFAIIGEEIGFIGCTFVIFIFIQFVVLGFLAAKKAPDLYGKLIAVGIVSIIAIQAAINIAVATGSMPVTGVPLPFISYGGTSLVINMTAVGVLLNITRHKNEINS